MTTSGVHLSAAEEDGHESRDEDVKAEESPRNGEGVTAGRRRAVDSSDLRSCALVQTKFKSSNTGPYSR